MDNLSHFHYDAEPFPEGAPTYIHDFAAQKRAISQSATIARFKAGLILISGRKGTGKSTILDLIGQRLGQGALTIGVSAREDTDIILSLLSATGVTRKKPDPEELAYICSEEYRLGKDVVFIIDDIDKLDEAEVAGFCVLCNTLPFLRIIATAGNMSVLGKLRKSKLDAPLLARFKLPRVSFSKAVGYLRSQSERALSLAYTTNPISIMGAMGLAFVGNRNLASLGKITNDALAEATGEGRPQITLGNVIAAAKKHSIIVRENIYFKAQKAFIYLLLGVIAYFAGRAFYERHWFMQEKEVRADLKQQEKKLID